MNRFFKSVLSSCRCCEETLRIDFALDNLSIDGVCCIRIDSVHCICLPE